jgi:hypothetical protein
MQELYVIIQMFWRHSLFAVSQPAFKRVVGGLRATVDDNGTTATYEGCTILCIHVLVLASQCIGDAKCLLSSLMYTKQSLTVGNSSLGQ